MYECLNKKKESKQTYESILFLLVWLATINTNAPLTYQRSHFGNIAYNAKLLKTDRSLIMIYGMNQLNADF